MSNWRATFPLWHNGRASLLASPGSWAKPVVPQRVAGNGLQQRGRFVSFPRRTITSTSRLSLKAQPIPSVQFPLASRPSIMPTEYTASDAFFEALWETGVRACFVNLGSDHPSLIEAMVKGQQLRKDRFPAIYTCPNEMVAVSMADGWARATGSPQAVIVHVDVGTQAIAAAMHNANTGRAPVLIFAGLCPYTEEGFEGSRTEYQHWLQDAPDQKAIIGGYCRYTGDFRTGRTVKQTVFRAMQLASSDPKGPVYLTGAREVMAEKIEQPYTIDKEKHGPIGPAALPFRAVETIAEALVHAKKPLIVTGYSGRNHACPEQLVRLAESIPGLRVLDTGGCDMCFPAGHPSYVGFRLSFDEITTEADLIFVLDCDVPWIPSRNPPRKDAKIYHVDIDPLNSTIGFSFFPADGRWKADSYTALTQLNQYLAASPDLQGTLQDPTYTSRGLNLIRKHVVKMESLSKLATPPPDGSLDIHHVGFAIKTAVPEDTVFVVEAATCAMPLSDQLQVNKPGGWINCGGAGLGWSGGAALGAKLAYDEKGTPKFICQVVGDGTYLFSVPSSVYWIASRYGIPVLTVVLNNRGWNAPRRSHELVHPEGLGATATNKQMHISFDPPPDYGGIAKASAGNDFGGLKDGIFVGRATTANELKGLLEQAVQTVQGGRGALIEAVLNVDEMGNSMVRS